MVKGGGGVVCLKDFDYSPFPCLSLLEFNHMIRTRIHDVGLAYRFYQQMNMHDQGQPDGFTRDEFQQITKAVTKLSLTPGQVDVLFNLFDKNHDGRLDADEFYGVLRNRGDKGLNNPKDLGVTAFFKRVVECIRDSD